MSIYGHLGGIEANQLIPKQKKATKRSHWDIKAAGLKQSEGG